MLTALEVAKLTTPGKHKDGGGLWLQVTTGKAGLAKKSWLWRFVSPVTGKERSMGLGSYPRVTLAEARKAAHRMHVLVHGGTDPLEERARQKAAASAGKPTFDDCARGYIEAHEAAWSAKHRSQWANSLATHASSVFGSLPIESITTERVLEALKPIWTTRPETASRVRQRIERVIDAAKAQGLRLGENPARWRGHLDHLLAKPSKLRGHFEAMPYTEVSSFMTRLGERGEIAAKALGFLILTACRTNEVLGARWEEIDWEARTWTIPARRAKAQREHRVPLSEPALAILQEMASLRTGEVIFRSFDKRSRGPLGPTALRLVLRRMGETCTTHGFRSAFRDWAGDCSHFPREIAEAALAHAVGGSTERAYRRLDALERRRALMASWGAYCGRGSNVVPFQAV
jgi:integrase